LPRKTDSRGETGHPGRCAPGDSNPHVRRHNFLRVARLPVPPGALSRLDGSWPSPPTAPRRRLRVTVRAQKPQVLRAVVEPVAIDVIDDQSQRSASPLRLESTGHAALLDPYAGQRRPQQRALRTRGTGLEHNQDLPGVLSGRPSTSIVRLPQKVARIDSGRADTTSEMGVRAPTQRHSECAQDAGE
jgi:hypothetical protein